MNDQIQDKRIRRFHRSVRRHVGATRARFDKGGGRLEETPVADQVAALVEEVGKLARCVNKLRIVQDDDVAADWQFEARHRCTTIAAVASRIATTDPIDRHAQRWEDLL